jgi:SAM-dependent methyltransferase
MRAVGPTDTAEFDNPAGHEVLRLYGNFDYRSVFDFGCGCGRLARQLLQQTSPPQRYVGVDLNRSAVTWCQENLARPGFSFSHLDVANPQFNPSAANETAVFPVEDQTFTLAIAWSVFTHVVEAQADFYLGECARVLEVGARVVSTWFLFDKTIFPMMQETQNALYINPSDPTNAVIFDRNMVLALFAKHGLGVVSAFPPGIRGFQWVIVAEKGVPHQIERLPEDTAPTGVRRAPISA